MRLCRLPAAVLLAALPAAAPADTGRWAGTVEVDNVEVRSGPALGLQATGLLHKGDTVVVVGEENKFYAIEPPAGSVSFVRAIHLGKPEAGKDGKSNAVVEVASGTEVRAGDARGANPVDKMTMRLPQGAIVEIVGPVAQTVSTAGVSGPTASSIKWYGITPPAGDVRWVHKSAVKKSLTPLPAPTVTAAKPDSADPIGGAARAAPPPVGAAGRPPALADHKLLDDAERAEEAGDHALAATLYAKICEDLRAKGADRDSHTVAYNRWVRANAIAKGGVKMPAADAPVVKAGVGADAGTKPVEMEVRKPAPEAKPTSIGPGRLREVTNLILDGVQVYKLEDDQGYAIAYVLPQKGVALRDWLNQKVVLTGAMATNPVFQKPYMSAETVRAAK